MINWEVKLKGKIKESLCFFTPPTPLAELLKYKN